MEIRTVKTARKNLIWIILLSILCLILISFLPWISVTEDGMLKENLNFNYEMMKGSNNQQINDLARNLMYINILFWTIIVISLISFLFITYYALIKSSFFSLMMVLTSAFIIFALSLLVIYFQINFSRSFNDIEYISASMINSYFAYAYIQFIISLILIVFSVKYTITFFKDSIKLFKSISKQKTKTINEIEEKDITTKFEEKEIGASIKGLKTNKSSFESEREAKLAEIEIMLAKKEQIPDKDKIDEDKSKSEPEIEEPIELSSHEETLAVVEETKQEIEQENKKEDQEEKISIQPFPPEKPKEKSKDTDEVKLSQYFEEALSSAIKKKQSKIKTKESIEKDVKQKKPSSSKQVEQKQEKTEPIFQTEKILLEKKGNKIKKIFNVKCPECNHIFTNDKEGNNKKIKCPECGKEGTLKKEF